MFPFVLTLFLAGGCGYLNPRQELDPKVYYRHDMKVWVDGVYSEGTIVVPKKPSYQIKLEAAGKLDILKIISCHRETAVQGSSGFLVSNKTYSFQYVPIPGIESEKPCPLRLEGYEEKHGRHSWAIVDFQENKHQLPATVLCNGSFYQFKGVSICQSRQGLLQMIQFPSPVKVKIVSKIEGRSVQGDNCKLKEPEDKKTWAFEMPNRECYFAFLELEPPFRTHRFTTVGFEENPIR